MWRVCWLERSRMMFPYMLWNGCSIREIYGKKDGIMRVNVPMLEWLV